MENASKALLIAAEILVGVLLLSLMATLFYITTNYQTEINQNLGQKEVNEFNAKFLAYKDKDLTAQDVLTIYNIVKDYNNKYESELIKVTGISGVSNRSDFLSPDETKVYYIEAMEADTIGKINKIVIKEKR